ncbi:hypothetical protein VFPPC_06794 [Pochonia chlamydosporia 170]|uniref:Gfd2/YDR514C-like C-terminal domain-containing protein n=1 Tax=Pochonia chlamydosporia 170 TaxID=1380566 RepID=A0A179F5H9_METCM|nr:hypothetical protein VFPPC_06794 [Pochonia chlamydosporia 170]OAQ60684.1 hypothetical protein VFPPC_06794 [Pochonia chlamydosporia 170]
MSPLSPDSIGNLRPSTVALRHIFGHSDLSLNTPLALEDTNFGAKLPDSPVTDLLLVSADIDTGSFLSYRILDNEKQYSIGISVLDTRKIQAHSKSTAQDERHQHTIQSFQFTVGQGTYVNRACRRFLFGETKPIIFSELKAEFDAIVQGREYVLICHGSQADMMVLRQLDIGQQALYILDTVYASRFPLQLDFQPSLGRLLEVLGIPFHNLHAAGNDAHFVLKALLLLAVRDARVEHVVPSKAVLEVLMGLEDIARSPVPAPKPKPPQKAPRIKQPNSQNSPKGRILLVQGGESGEDWREKLKSWKIPPVLTTSLLLMY